MRILSATLCALLAIGASVQGQTRPAHPSASLSSKTVYILSTGQSNVTGRNDGSGDATVNPNVLAWNGSAWVVMQEGVSPMGTAVPYDPSPNPTSNNATWAFAKAIQLKTGAQVKVILLSWGGESITNWVPSSSTYYSFIRGVMNAIGNPPINFLIWDQGEADNTMSDTNYLNNLKALITQFRAETWFPFNTQIILTGLDYVSDPTYSGPHFTQRAFAASGDPFIHFAETTGLTTVYGGVHWSGPATVTLGSKIYLSTLETNPNSMQELTASQRQLIAQHAPDTWIPGVVHDPATNAFYKWTSGAWTPVTSEPLVWSSPVCVLERLSLGYFGCAHLRPTSSQH